MKICHFAEFEDQLMGGIKSSINQQRKALEENDIEFTTDPGEEHDILHLNFIGPISMYHLLKAKRNGTPVIFHVHSTVEDFRNSFRFSNIIAPLFDRYTQYLYRKADFLIPVSEHTENLLNDKGIETPKEVVNNGFEKERLEGFDEREGSREKFDIDGFSAVNLAMVFERKGVSDFVKVAEKLSDVQFRWFGEKLNGLLSSRKANKAMDRAPENARFEGYVDDVRDAFAAGDVFFFPSHQEHQPIALIEALYCGIPLVVRDIPQYDGWLEDEVHCLKGESVEEFVENIQRLKDDPELREKLSENAKELSEHHKIPRIADDLEEIYSSM